MTRYYTVDEAAVMLGLKAHTLRSRCYTWQKRNKQTGQVTAIVAPGATAVKIGRSWRIRFEEGGGGTTTEGRKGNEQEQA